MMCWPRSASIGEAYKSKPSYEKSGVGFRKLAFAYQPPHIGKRPIVHAVFSHGVVDFFVLFEQWRPIFQCFLVASLSLLVAVGTTIATP